MTAAVVRRSREARVDEILAAARELFCAKGYEAAAVAEIASRVGVAEPTVFKYFPSKRELLLKVLEHWYEEMFGDYARDLAGVSGARARLQLLIWRHLRSLRDYPLLCRLMFLEVRAEADYHNTRLHELNRQYTGLLVQVLEEGIKRREFRPVPVKLLRDLVYGGIEHHCWNYFNGRGQLDIDSVAEQLTDVICQGVTQSITDPRATNVSQPSRPRTRALQRVNA